MWVKYGNDVASFRQGKLQRVLFRVPGGAEGHRLWTAHAFFFSLFFCLANESCTRVNEFVISTYSAEMFVGVLQ